MREEKLSNTARLRNGGSLGDYGSGEVDWQSHAMGIEVVRTPAVAAPVVNVTRYGGGRAVRMFPADEIDRVVVPRWVDIGVHPSTIDAVHKNMLPAHGIDHLYRPRPFSHGQTEGVMMHGPENMEQERMFELVPACEMINQVLLQLTPLADHVWKVDKKPRAHVLVQLSHGFGVCILIATGPQVAIFEETSAPDLLRVPGRYELHFEVPGSGVVVAVNTLGEDGGIEFRT